MRYENFSDEELLNMVYMSGDALARAVGERLEMRLRDLDELEHSKAKRDPQSPRPHPDDPQLKLF